MKSQQKNDLAQKSRQIGRIISLIVILRPIVKFTNILHYANQSDNFSAELVTFHALRLSVKTLFIDCETCYTLLKGTVRKVKYSHTFTFAIYTHNRNWFANRRHASLSPEQIG